MSCSSDTRGARANAGCIDALPPKRRALPSRTPYPPGATNANWFGLFNALSWQITLGSPMILYAKSLGASALTLGLLASFTPLLVILQLPAAHWLPRWGYRRFILAGWGSRTVLIFALAAIPLLPWLGSSMRLALVVLCLFLFNLLRGMASGAWLPWISELIPGELRGRFLSRDQIFAQVGSLFALGIAAVVLSSRTSPEPWQFSLAFAISAVGATVSLWFCRRIPDVTAPDALKRSGAPVPWQAMLTYPPFFRLMLFNVLYFAAAGGLGVFTVAYLKGRAGYSESSILWLSVLAIVGALLTLPRVGHVLDRKGSKPVLRSSVLTLLLVVAGWWAVSANLVGQGPWIVGALNLIGGMAGAGFGVANARMVMATMPLMGRNHFFALFTVITNLALAASPIVWGALLDLIGQAQYGQAISWNRYSIYFALAFAVGIVALAFEHRLAEAHQTVSEVPLRRPSPVPAVQSAAAAGANPAPPG